MKTQQVFDGTQVFHQITFTEPSSLIQLIQTIFDDITIYNNKRIRKLIQSSPKGFIDVDQLTSLPMFMDFVEKNPNILVTPDEIIKCVYENSRKLVAIDYRVRRIEPFVDNIRNKKLTPIYVDRLPTKSTDEICQFFKNIVGVVYQIYHKKVQKWAIIVIDNFEVLQPIKDQLYFEGQKISVLNPLQTLISYGDNERLSSDFNIVKLYQNKNMWQFPQQNSHSQQQDNMNMKQRSRHQKFQQIQDMEEMQELYDGDDESINNHIKGRKQYRSQKYDRKFHRGYGQDQFDHRMKNKQIQKRLRSQVYSILNFDNTPLLALRNQNTMTQ